MKIAQVAPLEESVPPRLYGGTERVVSYLTEALVELGHEVTLFASGDSVTEADLLATCPRALRLDPTVTDPTVAMDRHLQALAARADGFDVIHSHIDYAGFPLLKRLAVPSVTTLHGRLDLPDGPPPTLYGGVNIISISESQRRPLPQARYVATVLHGLPQLLLEKADGAGGYLAFLGRMSAEKGADAAIRIANAAGVHLKMAAKVGVGDRPYFESTVAPLLDRGAAEFVGEIHEHDKQEFLGEAGALIFPIAWPEPFGLVMIEAMACGTPVIAYDQGSVREILDDGVTGFIVRNEREATEAVARIGTLDRDRIRTEFESRFTSRRMALDYVAAYRRLSGGSRKRRAMSHTEAALQQYHSMPTLTEPV